MVCNLDQNPLKRPILGAWLPALLKAGTMWLLRAPVSGATTDVDPSERWLLDIVAWYIGWHPPNIIDTSSRPQPHLINMVTLTKVSLEDMGHRIQACGVAPFLQTTHLHCMGLPQWPIPGSRAPFPIFTYQPAPTVRKRLAGNVTWHLRMNRNNINYWNKIIKFWLF